jgi:homoserine dehydrogenase
VSRTGITRLTARDFRYARELGYAIKLLASGRLVEGELVASVQPVFVAQSEPLARVDGVLNAVQVEGDLVGRVLFEGPGAGPMPTASAVLADVLDVARDLVAARPPAETIAHRAVKVRPASKVTSRFYLRVTVADRPGVLARIAAILGRQEISIASVIQFETDESAGTAELVITTHATPGGKLTSAVRQIEALDVVTAVGNVLPMVGSDA